MGVRYLGSDFLQQEVDGPVDVPIAVVKGHHALILISACDLNELQTQKGQLGKKIHRAL